MLQRLNEIHTARIGCVLERCIEQQSSGNGRQKNFCFKHRLGIYVVIAHFIYMGVCACVRACVHACVRVCVHL